MSNSNNTVSIKKYKKELDDVNNKIENLKNPDSVNLDNDINDENRNIFYEKIKNIHPHEIISLLANCGELTNDYDFWRIDEKVVKHQINKMENLKNYLLKKINNCGSNNLYDSDSN